MGEERSRERSGSFEEEAEEDDEVELEKSNVLLMGPTGSGTESTIVNRSQLWSAVVNRSQLWSTVVNCGWVNAIFTGSGGVCVQEKRCWRGASPAL